MPSKFPSQNILDGKLTKVHHTFVDNKQVISIQIRSFALPCIFAPVFACMLQASRRFLHAGLVVFAETLSQHFLSSFFGLGCSGMYRYDNSTSMLVSFDSRNKDTEERD